MKRILIPVLQAVGILVFAVGIAMVPLSAGFASARFGYPWFAWMFGLVSLALWLWLGDRFVRIGEIRLEHSLRPGTTIAQDTKLIHSAGGDPYEESPNILTVRFVALKKMG